MSSRLLPLLVVFFLATVTSSPTISGTNVDGQSSNVFVEIETSEGVIFDDFINISGESSIPVSELIWSIDNIEQYNSFVSSTESIVSSSTFTV